jgi:Ca-activated chloride channel family protein
LGKFEEADAAYHQTLKAKNPQLAAKAWYNLGNNFLQQGKFADALEPYVRALKINPKDEDALNNLALALRFLKKPPAKKNQNKQEQKQGQGQGGKGQGQSQDKNSSDQKPGAGKNQSSQKPSGSDDKGEKKADNKGESNSRGQNAVPGNKVPKPGEMSPEDASNLLDAIRESEKEAQQKRLNGSMDKGKKGRTNVPEDW